MEHLQMILVIGCLFVNFAEISARAIPTQSVAWSIRQPIFYSETRQQPLVDTRLINSKYVTSDATGHSMMTSHRNPQHFDQFRPKNAEHFPVQSTVHIDSREIIIPTPKHTKESEMVYPIYPNNQFIQYVQNAFKRLMNVDTSKTLDENKGILKTFNESNGNSTDKSLPVKSSEVIVRSNNGVKKVPTRQQSAVRRHPGFTPIKRRLNVNISLRPRTGTISANPIQLSLKAGNLRNIRLRHFNRNSNRSPQRPNRRLPMASSSTSTMVSNHRPSFQQQSGFERPIPKIPAATYGLIASSSKHIAPSSAPLDAKQVGAESIANPVKIARAKEPFGTERISKNAQADITLFTTAPSPVTNDPSLPTSRLSTATTYRNTHTILTLTDPAKGTTIKSLNKINPISPTPSTTSTMSSNVKTNKGSSETGLSNGKISEVNEKFRYVSGNDHIHSKSITETSEINVSSSSKFDTNEDPDSPDAPDANDVTDAHAHEDSMAD